MPGIYASGQVWQEEVGNRTRCAISRCGSGNAGLPVPERVQGQKGNKWLLSGPLKRMSDLWIGIHAIPSFGTGPTVRERNWRTGSLRLDPRKGNEAVS